MKRLLFLLLFSPAAFGAVAFDAVTPSLRTATTDPWTFTCTPVGTAAGVALLISNNDVAASDIDTVTYGSASLTRQGSVYSDTASEVGNSEIWFAGSSIPAGAQTVTVDFVSASPVDDYTFNCVTVTAGANTEVIDTDGISEDCTDPSRTMNYSGRTALSVVTFESGHNDTATPGPTDIAWNANMTLLVEQDTGADIVSAARQTTPGTSDFVVSADTNAESDPEDCAIAVASISEVSAGGSVVPLIHHHNQQSVQTQ